MGRHSTGSLSGGLARDRQTTRFKTAFGVDIVTEIEALLGTGVVDEWDLEAIETAARRMAMRVSARVVEQRLNADTSDHAGPMLELNPITAGARKPSEELDLVVVNAILPKIREERQGGALVSSRRRRVLPRLPPTLCRAVRGPFRRNDLVRSARFLTGPSRLACFLLCRVFVQ